MMRRVPGTRDVVDKPWLAGSDLFEVLDVLDGLIRHRRFQVPAGIIEEGIDGGCIAEEVWLPLARVTTNEAIEKIPHSVGPLIERSGLARLIEGRVVVFAEPRGRITVGLQDRANRAFLNRNDRVVTREAGRYFADHTETYRVMVAACDNCCSRRRAQRRRMEIRVTQAIPRDAIHRRRGYHAAKRARRTETLVIRHDEQNVRRTLRRHDSRCPPRSRLRGLLPDHATEFWVGRWKLFPRNCSCRGR